MKRKNWPIVIMLLAGAITSIVTFIRGVAMVEKLLWLLITLVVFYGLGCLLVNVMNSFDKENERKLQEEKKDDNVLANYEGKYHII